jgi:hypothetical protein
MQWDGWGVAGGSEMLFGTYSVTSSSTAIVIQGTFDPLGGDAVDIEVLEDGVIVGATTVPDLGPGGYWAEVTREARGPAYVYPCVEKLISMAKGSSSQAGLGIGFEETNSFDIPFDGSHFEGDEIRFHDAANPRTTVEHLTSVALRLGSFDNVEILDVTIQEAGVPCADITQFVARCLPGGPIQSRVRFEDDSHDGETLRFLIDGTDSIDAVVANARAQISVPGYSPGPHTVELIDTDPAGCSGILTVSCAASSSTTDLANDLQTAPESTICGPVHRGAAALE